MSNVIGQTLLEQYRVDAFVASGGMGAVYRVWDLKRNVPLAMKVLHAELAEDPSVFKSFQREARALQKLAHPNIVPFYGLYQTLDFAFLLERYIDGPSLKDILRQRQGKPLSVEEALTYLKALCAALGYAHANGVIHCDVKPGNVMIDRGGNVYLTDFGIARHAESTTTTLAGAGAPQYMAPEQIRSEAVTPATDVYALGVMLFEMLTGQRPFKGTEAGTERGGTTAAERVRYAHQHLPPPDPRLFNPTLSPGMTSVTQKAMAKRPSERFANTQSLFQATCIAAGATAESVPERIVLPAIYREKPEIGAGQIGPVALKSEGSRTWQEWWHQRNKRTVAMMVGGVALVAIIMIIAMGRGPTPLPTTGASGSEAKVYPVQSIEAPRLQSSPIPTSPATKILNPTLTKVAYPTETSHPSIQKPTDTSLPTAIPTRVRTSPEEFVNYYYNSINKRDYELTWSLLSQDFRERMHNSSQGGYQGYVEFWNTIDRVVVTGVDIISVNETSAIIIVNAIYYYKSGATTNSHQRFQLIYDKVQGSWLFDG